MGLLKKLFTNCACPQGRMGRAMLRLGLVEIQNEWTMLDNAGFTQTEIHRKKLSYATIIGVKK